MDSEPCPVCFEILYEAHQILPCKHLLCKLCCNQMKSMAINHCPYCREIIGGWEHNSKVAQKVKKSKPEDWHKRKKDEKNQVSIKKSKEERLADVRRLAWEMNLDGEAIIALLEQDRQQMSFPTRFVHNFWLWWHHTTRVEMMQNGMAIWFAMVFYGPLFALVFLGPLFFIFICLYGRI